ncbi:MAG: MFS transporter [Candidatus Hodarchaeales archaeon]|jgi:MFS family permease
MMINNLLGTEDLPERAQSHMRTVLSVGMAISFLMSLSSTFYVVFVIDQIGYTLAAVSTSVMLFTQLIFDYPSGSLGDWIGQRSVLALAFISYSVTFFLLITANTFEEFAFISIINGFGNAQSSGTFETWIDNNYRKSVIDRDSDRRTYGFVMSRISSMNNFALGASFLIGGALATEISREFVFSVQFVLSLIVIILIMVFIKDLESTDELVKEKSTTKGRSYLQFMIGGIRVMFKDQKTFLFIMGMSIYNVVWLIWGNLLLFPIYFGYTGTDVLASSLRTFLFFIGIPVSFYMANITKRIQNERLSTFILLQILFFFPSFFALTYLVPPTNEFNLIGLIGTFFLLSTLVGTLFNISTTLSQRILLDLVPSENRNAVYSLMPSIVSLLGIPILPIAGAAVDTYGLHVGLILAGLVCIIGYIFIFLSLRLDVSFSSEQELTLDLDG